MMSDLLQAAFTMSSALVFVMGVWFLYTATTSALWGTVTDKSVAYALFGIGWMMVVVVIQTAKVLLRKP